MDVAASIDPSQLNPLLGSVVNELGAAHNAALVAIGDKLNLYRALADAYDATTVAELAEKTGMAERYLREWISAQAAAGFVTYDQTTGRFAYAQGHAWARRGAEAETHASF